MQCSFNYDPICGKAQNGKRSDITFGSQCVLDKYNCEHNNERMKKYFFYIDIKTKILYYIEFNCILLIYLFQKFSIHPKIKRRMSR